MKPFNAFSNVATLSCGDKSLDLTFPHVMGVLNTTPDSFSDGGQFFNHGSINVDSVLKRAEQMVADGATILDVGGESTRPGAAPVTAEQEMQRVAPVVEVIKKNIDVVVSVDTSTPSVMQEAAKLGAGLLNDVRALSREGALETAAQLNLPICLMHMQGEPSSMQNDPQYNNVVNDVANYLKDRVNVCIEAGIDKQQLLLDPGFGFGKTLEHNLQLLNQLDHLHELGLPLLVGMSRKRMIGEVLNKEVDQRLYGSLSLAVLAVSNGAQIIRAHDVAATADAIKMAHAVMQG